MKSQKTLKLEEVAKIEARIEVLENALIRETDSSRVELIRAVLAGRRLELANLLGRDEEN